MEKESGSPPKGHRVRFGNVQVRELERAYSYDADDHLRLGWKVEAEQLRRVASWEQEREETRHPGASGFLQTEPLPRDVRQAMAAEARARLVHAMDSGSTDGDTATTVLGGAGSPSEAAGGYFRPLTPPSALPPPPEPASMYDWSLTTEGRIRFFTKPGRNPADDMLSSPVAFWDGWRVTTRNPRSGKESVRVLRNVHPRVAKLLAAHDVEVDEAAPLGSPEVVEYLKFADRALFASRTRGKVQPLLDEAMTVMKELHRLLTADSAADAEVIHKLREGFVSSITSAARLVQDMDP